MKPIQIVLGVIGFDCHSVGNKILEVFFSSKGVKVHNLGVMVSQEEFINAAMETGAEAVMVSSLYGHGEIDCEGLRAKCDEKGLDGILLYVGGNLVVGKTPLEEVEAKFKAMGYDRVFGPDADLEVAYTHLLADLTERGIIEKDHDTNASLA